MSDQNETDTENNERTGAEVTAMPNPRALAESVRRHISDMPTAVRLWFVAGFVLLAVELPIYLSGIHTIGNQIVFGMNGVGEFPKWVGGNFEDVLGPVAGAVVHDLTALLILFVFASMFVWFVLPWRIVDQFDLDRSRREKSYIERGIWTGIFAAIAVVVALTPFGDLVHQEVGFYAGIVDTLAEELPRLTSRETIPNRGYQAPDGGGWQGTFMGLSPRAAWALRAGLVLVYAIAGLFWAWKGYDLYREHYREADWTPRDDTLRRFRNHYWGIFGFVVVFLFVVMAVWAPSLGTVPIEEDVYEPWQHEFEYVNDDGEVDTVLYGRANIDTRSNGQNTVGPDSYDRYGRYHPMGTTARGNDMLTIVAYGARTSLIIGLTATFLGAFIAVSLSLITAYYKGLADIITILASDTIISIPAFLLIMMLSVLFQDANHPIIKPMDGGLLLALVFAFAFWPGLWRAIRGPSLQVAEQEWVDAAKSYGQSPVNIMRKHMAPYVFGYIMIYASLLLGSMVIITAALSFLGLGINHPTPEWGRLINSGRPFISTSSWHISTLSGILIVMIVLGFNALGDGLRDAIDPEADVGETATTGAGGGG